MKQNIYILILFLFSFISAETFEGYSVFSAVGGENETSTIIMDNEFNQIHSWIHENRPASMPYLLQDSSIVYPYRVDNPTMWAGGVGGGIRKINWNGEVEWEYIFADEQYQHHHDIEPLENGNILILAWERKTAEEAYAMGRREINNTLGEMWSVAVLELNPLNGEIVWEWHLWDHLIQDTDSSLPNYGNISDHPELFDINCGVVGTNAGGPQQPNADWIHMNSIHYNPLLDQIVMSSRLQNELYIIDHSTTSSEAASHSGGISGKGGDILYRWGNPQNYGRGDASDQLLSSQHSVNWIPQGYPGEGNLILFNNFHSSGISAAFEISTSLNEDGIYEISDNGSFGPQTWTWIYECDITVPMQGGSFRLENGNTLITQTHIGRIIEVNQMGDIVWDYIHQTDEIDTFWIARSQKYALDYLEANLLGDINEDGIINVLDAVSLVNIILANGPYMTQADINLDGSNNVLDVVLMVNVIINGLP